MKTIYSDDPQRVAHLVQTVMDFANHGEQ